MSIDASQFWVLPTAITWTVQIMSNYAQRMQRSSGLQREAGSSVYGEAVKETDTPTTQQNKSHSAR